MTVFKSVARQMNNLATTFENLTDNIAVRRILFGCALLVIFGGVYILNSLHMLYGDDWSYSMFGDNHLNSFGQILESQYRHYFVWGGRTIVHIIAQTLLLLGSPWNDLLNSMAFVALIVAVYYLVKKKDSPYNVSLLIGITMLVWLFQPAFAQTMLWIVGSANYLWGTLIIVLFLIPFKLHFLNANSNDNLFKTILFLFAGIIAGWTNENMAVALVCIVSVFLVLFKIREKRIPRWAITALIGTITGTILLIAAPGNYVRYAEFPVEQSSIVLRYLGQFISALASFYYYCLPLAFILALSFIIHRYYGKTELKKGTFILSSIWLAGALIATLVMSASPFFPGRASFGINTLLIISIAALYANLDFRSGLIKGIAYTSLIFALLFFVADYYRGYKDLDDINTVFSQRIEIVKEAKQQGIKHVTFVGKPIEQKTRFVHYYDFFNNPELWDNNVFSKYYGIESVEMKPE
ncbi:hypothetical protein D0T53_08790 [Dysgonomonas sp. 216]|uniref:DUF3329 domain-containing protein n=1 Tax=Dysgonomonas sp. 216 TaxID=2302934 RepID=UPI0013D2E653|nr:DUF6056 family protein [Dysgonomonas sp. 216]NDW19006.1 hypothetical protein [Dysgonomonas sp. 216]